MLFVAETLCIQLIIKLHKHHLPFLLECTSKLLGVRFSLNFKGCLYLESEGLGRLGLCVEPFGSSIGFSACMFGFSQFMAYPLHVTLGSHARCCIGRGAGLIEQLANLVA